MEAQLLREVVASAIPAPSIHIDDQWRPWVDALRNFITETESSAFDVALKASLAAPSAPTVAAAPAETAPQDPSGKLGHLKRSAEAMLNAQPAERPSSTSDGPPAEPSTEPARAATLARPVHPGKGEKANEIGAFRQAARPFVSSGNSLLGHLTDGEAPDYETLREENQHLRELYSDALARIRALEEEAEREDDEASAVAPCGGRVGGERVAPTARVECPRERRRVREQRGVV